MNDFFEVSTGFGRRTLIKISAIRYIMERSDGGCYIAFYGKDNCLSVDSSYEEVERAIRKAKEEE